MLTPKPMLARMGRALTFVGAFLVASIGTWTAADSFLTSVNATRHSVSLDILDSIRAWQLGMLADKGHERIAFIGDSVLLSAAGEPSVPSSTGDALHLQGGRASVAAIHPIALAGATTVSQNFLADEIIRVRPDRAVIELNLRSFGPTPLGPFAFPELSGWVAANHVPETARLPLGEANLTLNRLLFYQLLVGAGLDRIWARVLDRQVKLYDARDPLETALDAALSRKALLERKLRIGLVRMARAMIPGKNRSPGTLLRQVFGNVLHGLDERQPRVRYLLSTLDRLREANIPTLLWIAPINVDHMREEAIPTEPIARSAATLTRLAEAHGARLVDLHAVLRDADFRDYSDHIHSVGTPAPTQRIGRLLARAIVSTTTTPLRAELRPLFAEGDHAVQ